VDGTCGVATGGDAWCFGWDPRNDAVPPAPVVPGRRFIMASGSHYQGCAIDVEGTAWCWGPQLLTRARGEPAEACDGPWQRPCAVVPRPVSASLRFRVLHVGGSNGDLACGITTAGETWCWGRADPGALGTAAPDSVCAPHGCYAPPTRIATALTFRTVAVGGGHACGLDADGRAFCWGSGSQLQLGEQATDSCSDGTFAVPCSRTPVAVRGGHAFTGLALGAIHSCGLLADGRALCWGSNIMGQLGTDRELQHCAVGHMGAPCTADPVPVEGARRFTDLGAYHQHTCGLVGGEAWCWGEGNTGQLGQGTIDDEHPWGTRRFPVRVVGGHRFRDLSVSHVVCGRRHDSALLCWGLRSPFRHIAAPEAVPPPPPPLLASFTPRAAAHAPPLAASFRDGHVLLTGGGPARCSNHTFHAAPAVSDRTIELLVMGQRWLGGGCDPSTDSFAWDAVLSGLAPGAWRVRVVYHTSDDRGEVMRLDGGVVDVVIPG
jgi:hypothetical protein